MQFIELLPYFSPVLPGHFPGLVGTTPEPFRRLAITDRFLRVMPTHGLLVSRCRTSITRITATAVSVA
jgi:hypothetical protein